MLEWIKSIFTDGAAKLVGSIGSIIDNVHTSEEEKLKLKNELAAMVEGFKLEHLKLLGAYDKEVTERHANDMKSDSWLSKNIRPLTLAFMVVMTVALAYVTTLSENPPDKDILEPWIALLTTLDVTMFSFYFGSRGLEKIASVIGNSFGKDK